MGLLLPLLLFLAVVVIVPAALVIAAPAFLARATLGWVLLGVGLLVIAEHTSTFMPYDDDGVFPSPGPLIFLFWGALLPLAIVARRKALWPDADEMEDHPVYRCWSVPLGILAAVTFMHWLRNRLAGAEPADAVHIAVAACFAIAFALMAWGAFRAPAGFRFAFRATAALAISGLLLTGANAGMGMQMWTRAEDFAAGRPHCVMTYGGFETSRPARSGWDLSPLVNRRYATWAVSKAPVVILAERDGPRMYRYFNDQWRDVTSSELQDQPPQGWRPPC